MHKKKKQGVAVHKKWKTTGVCNDDPRWNQFATTVGTRLSIGGKRKSKKKNNNKYLLCVSHVFVLFRKKM